MRFATGPMPRWCKALILCAGLALFLPGLPIAVWSACALPLVLLFADSDALLFGMMGFTLLVLTFGAGGVVTWHARRSLLGKPSRQLVLPPAWQMAGLFGLCIVAGLVVRTNVTLADLFFPLVLFAAAAIPPLWAVSWFAGGQSEGLTYRRGLVALAGGATVGVALALLLEIVLPFVVLALVWNVSDGVVRNLQDLLSDLTSQQTARAVTNPGFIYAFIQLALIAPLAEEMVKPLVTLPLIGRLSRRDAFLVAAMAGAGFAAIENVLYASLGAGLWAGILVLRSLGAAIHPLGAGLVGLSWREVLNGEPGAWRHGLARAGLAAGFHALWNGGTLIVVALAGARFFGPVPPNVDILGLSAAGTTLALLFVLGLAALALGRAVALRTRLPFAGVTAEGPAPFSLSDRAVALWAFACLIAIVPVGVAALRLMMG